MGKQEGRHPNASQQLQDHACVFLVGHCVLWPCQERQMGPRSNSVYLVSYEFSKQLRAVESQHPLKPGEEKRELAAPGYDCSGGRGKEGGPLSGKESSWS